MEHDNPMSNVDFTNSKVLKYLGFGVLGLGLLSVCFTPSDLTFTRLENFLLPVLLVVIILAKKIRIEGAYFPVLLAFAVCYAVSIFLNGDGIGDISYAFRTLKILLFLILSAQLLHEHHLNFDKIIRSTFLIISAVVLLEFFNPMGIYEIFFSFFTHHNMEKFDQLDSIRIIGTMMNPNDNGVLLTCFIAYFMSSYHSSKNKWNLLFGMLGLVLVILSQSRTSLIAVLVMGVPFLLTFRITRTMIFSVVGSAIVVVAAMHLLQMNYMMELLSKNPLEISAFQARFRDWGYIIGVWNEHKIWGAGPFADTFTAAGYFDPDSEYLYILASRGVVGLVCYLIILTYPILVFWKKRNEVKHALLAVLLSVAFMLIGVTNFSLLNVRIGVVYAIFIGIPFSFLLFKSESNKLNLAIPSFGSLFTKQR